jgi:opacity protein-like surface antigen
MKKTIFMLTILSLMSFSLLYAQEKSPSANVDCNYSEKYTGVDFNVGVGYSGVTFDHYYLDSARTRSEDDKAVSGTGFAVLGKLGGTYGFCKYWIVGLDVYGQYNSAKHTKQAAELFHERSITTKIDYNLGGDFRLGLVSRPSNMYFLTIGPDWGHYKMSYSSTHLTESYSNSSSEFKLGLRFGAGAEQKFSETWVVKEQFSYTWYQSIHHTHSDSSTSTVKPRLAAMTFSIGYLF